MKICWFGFLAKNHSWSLVAQNLSREFIKMGHDVDLFSTNGLEYFPEDLKPNLIGHIDEFKNLQLDYNKSIFEKLQNKKYDLSLSYTGLPNFKKLINRDAKNKFGIWCYEWEHLPKEFASQHKYVDKILAPSNFARDIFIKNGIPNNKVITIPHGITVEDYQNIEPYKLLTKKSKKIFVNIGQPHLRKNIEGMLTAFGMAFTKNDDVCLVAKIFAKKPTQPFEVNILELFNKFKKKFPNHAEIELITNYVPNIVSLYMACDIVYTLSFCEGFYLPGIEAIAANKINICPRYGGQLDFLNDENSILIDGKIIRADMKMQYWEASPYNGAFSSNLNDAALKLKDIVSNYDNYLIKFSQKMKEILPQYTWNKIALNIINLCNI